jgi:hypothetical protein
MLLWPGGIILGVHIVDIIRSVRNFGPIRTPLQSPFGVGGHRTAEHRSDLC